MNVEVNTTRFGVVQVPPDRIVFFQRGLIGFEHLKRYALLDSRKGAAIQWLQSLDEPEVAFLVSDPRLFLPGFQVRLQDMDGSGDLGQGLKPDELGIYTILHVNRDEGQLHVHVQSPLIIHSVTRKGIQVVTDAPSPTVPIPVPSASRPPAAGGE